MNWDAIGAVGEVVGAVSVVVSLVYLATQIRQGAIAQRAATLQAFAESMARASEELAHDELLGLFLRGQHGFSSLADEDRMSVHLMLVGLFRRFEALLLQMQLGLVDPEVATMFMKPIHGMAPLPGVRDWWSQWHGIFSAQFVEYVNNAIANPKFDLPSGFGQPAA